MTLCPTGSAPIVGAPPFVWITWLDAQSWLATVFSKLSPFVLPIPALIKEINAFCATDPPQPVYPGDTTVAAATTDPIAFEAVIQYLKDSAYWWVWSHNCQCNAAPGTCSILYPPSETFSNTATMGQTQWRGLRFQANVTATYYGLRVWLPPTAPPVTSIYLWRGSDGRLVHREDLATVNGYNDLRFVTPQPLVSATQYYAGYAMGTGGTVYYDAVAPAFPSPGNFTYMTWLHSVFEDPFTDISDAGTGEGFAPILCVGGPPPPGSPTTPANPPVPTTGLPDFPLEAACTTQDICNLAQQINSSLTLTRRMVDLIQRQEVPFAFLPGTAASGLTGSGNVAVQGITGLLATLTSVPSTWGATTDVPRRLVPKVGELRWVTPNGFAEELQLHYDSEVFRNPPPSVTAVHYSVRPGITLTLQPLLREP